jgi:hypothetical protein
MAPSPIKLVEPFIDFAALVVDDEGAVEVDVDVEEEEDDDDESEVVEVVVVIGTEKKDKVGCPDA